MRFPTLPVGESLREEPLLISQLVRFACRAIALESLEETLSRGQVGPNAMETLDIALHKSQDTGALQMGLEGELVITGRDAFRMSPRELKELITLFDHEFIGWLYVLSGGRELDQLAYLGRMELHLDVSRRPPEDRLKALSAVPDPNSLPFYCPVARETLLAMDRALREELKWIARTRAARTAVAIERFRAETGRIPGKLETLAPAYPEAPLKDPFDGNALRFRADGGGYVVYSIGPDGSDDGGKHRDRNDVTFTVGTPAGFVEDCGE